MCLSEEIDVIDIGKRLGNYVDEENSIFAIF